ncbi:MAG: hypothetical protein A2Y12_04730 [Planctomycetes bacterium GWF2_42_9]|nr:MAG: hypothetical protein A2Y12_04730 [Planctomycetes bacterium GWF2_42_9]
MKKHIVTKKNIIDSLRSLSLVRGDTVIVHSALSSFGKVSGGPDTIIDALLHTVGPQGTLVMPTFGSSDAVFDNKKSGTNLGIVTQTFWKRRGVLRSRHPFASVAAIGPNAKTLIDGHENALTAHGTGTPYYKLSQINGKILLLGVDQDRNTFLHTIEEVAKAAYLRPITGTYLDKAGRAVKKTWPYFPGPHRDFIGLQSFLRSAGLVKNAYIGTCKATLMEAAPLLETLLREIQKNPNLFLSANPNLPDGTRQKAQVLRSKMTDATFTLAADSQSAGTYIEEIIDNLKAAGIDHLMLSTINHVPWQAIAADKRKWYLTGLKNAGIKIAALRVTTADKKLQQTLAEIKTNSLIVPSTVPLEKVKKHIPPKTNVMVENTGIPGKDMVACLLRLQQYKLKAMTAFNPLEFVKIGENPLLTTYTRTSIKSMMGAIFVNDGFASGKFTQLENGLAEIKELISILLCRSFSGLFILQAPDPSQFTPTANKFFQMYDEVR